MGRRKRGQRRFTPEFKREAVKFLLESGKPMKDVAEELGISPSSLGRWRDEYEGKSLDGDEVETPEEELTRLHKRVRELEMEREILKKAAAFFAKESE